MWLASTFSGSLGRLHYHLGSRTSALSTCVKLWDYESEGFLSGQDRALVLNFGGVCFQRGHICTIAEAAANRFFPQIQIQTSSHSLEVTLVIICQLSASAFLQDLLVLQGFDVYKLDTGDLSYSELNRIAGP